MKMLTRLLVFTGALNALAWITIIPVWQYPDEQAHFAQVQNIAQTGFVPQTGFDTSYEIALSEKILSTQRDGQGNNKFTYHPEYKLAFTNSTFGPNESLLTSLPRESRTQMVKNESTHNPPAYYFLSSFFYKIVNNSDLITRVYAIRLFSLFLFTLNVLTAYKIGKLLFEKNHLLTLTLTSFIAFNPMLIFSSTGILPDPLTNLLFSIVIYFSLKIIKEGLTTLSLLGVFASIVLGLLTRQQFLIAVFIAIIPITLRLITQPRLLVKVLIFSLISSVPIYISSFVFAPLSFLRAFSAPEIGWPKINLIFTQEFYLYFLEFLKKSFSQTLPWYWGVYKWLSLTLPPLTYQIINRIILVSIFGLVIYYLKCFSTKKITSQVVLTTFLIFISVIYFVMFGIWDFFFSRQYGYSFGFQGRYFFPLITAHMAILIIGLWEIIKFAFKKYSKFALSALVILVILFHDFSLMYIASWYYNTQSLGNFINHASQYKPILFKGNIIFFLITLALISQVAFIYNLAKETTKYHERNLGKA